jgi:4-amino-4-deoxy-L-arabinose transferase-like glycosyltransferase
MKEAFAGLGKRTAGFLLLALALRLFFSYACPHVAGDSPIYEGFARNLLKSGTYSHLEPQDNAALRPTMIRAPGYPLMLAAIFAIAGTGNETAVRVVQAFLDTFTCLLIALIVFEISDSPDCHRRRRAQWALFLSALCPFSANYSASILTEVPTTLLCTAGTLFGLRALKRLAPRKNWFYCGLLAGAATLFRPESGLLLAVFGLVLLCKEGSRRVWKPILAGASLGAAGLALALLPWTVRNALTLRTFQPLAPMYAQDQDERVPLGYIDWCRTWLWKYRDITLYLFPLETSDLPTSPLPSGAGAGEDESKKILDLIKRHNEEGDTLDPVSDQEFEVIAREHRQGHPLRCYLTLPLLRSLAMWFTPRVEILNLEGRLLPLSQSWDNDRVDFSFTLLLFLINIAYLALALGGMGRILRRSRSFKSPEFLGSVTLLAAIAVRTVFFACFAFPEPRYVLEVYPDVIALGAFVFLQKATR